MANSSTSPNRADTAARAQNLISMAYQLPLASRTDWLRAQCSDDDRLRREVSWMLEALRAPDDEFLEGRPNVDTLDAMPDEISVPAPRDYRIVRPLGEGGMGTVYLAERFDGDYTQSVALKFLNSFALVNPAVVSRFVDERRILAQLSHPNIAHLVDGGTLGDGRPFLAMEYVDGVRIDQDCDARQLNEKRRLIQFLKVCGGVDYAHQRLIIHRDIKPANILVGADGEPKLLDFGIARLIDAQGEQTRTEAGLRMMTLAYASPEQIAGRVLTTATDIYSLGVLLFELLTGSRPWRDEVSAAELAREISESEAPAPSVIARRNRTQRPIDGDLDAIVLKTLRKEPTERYSSVRELADDIRNYLDSRPVLARRGHRAYRLRKFVARHRVGVTVSALLATMIVAFALDRQVQLDATREQRARAESERLKAEQVSRVLTNVFVSADLENAGTREPTVREVLSRSAARARAQLNDQPHVQATVLTAIANTLLALGRRDEAGALADDVTRRLDRSTPANRLLLVPATIIQAEVARAAGNRDGALALAREAVALASPATPTSGTALAAAHRTVLWALIDLQRPRQELVDAAAASMAALEIAESTPIDKARTLIALARALREKTHYDESLPYARRAVALTADLPDDHPVRLQATIGLGFSLMLGDHIAEAKQLVAPVIPSQRALAERTGDARQASSVLMSLGGLQFMLARYELAAQTFSAAREVLPDDVDTIVRARIEHNIASAWLETGDLPEARRATERVVATTRALGEDNLAHLNALAQLADVMQRQGDLDAAADTIRRALAGMAANPDTPPEDVNVALTKRARVELARGEPAAAAATIRQVIAARSAAGGPESPLVARSQISLAEALIAAGDRDGARDALVHADRTLATAGEHCAPNAVAARKLWSDHGFTPALVTPLCD